MPHAEKPYKYIPLSQYPHMRPADVDIWYRFILANPGRFYRVWYDFRVGDHSHVSDDCLNCIKTGWYDLTRWAIDVVAEDDSAFYIIEVKPSANSKALGQAEAYADLFREQEAPAKKVIPVVLTNEIIATTKRVADIWGTQLWLA